MPTFLSPRRSLAYVLLVVLAVGLPSAAHSLSSSPLTPMAEMKLRRLLPFPEATLIPRMEMTMGLGYSLDQGFHFFRQSSDYAGRIVAVRRQMTGSPADAAGYRQLGSLYRQAGLSAKSIAAFQHSKALYNIVLVRHPGDGAALAGYGRTLDASGQAAVAETYLRKAAQITLRSADVWLALGSVLEEEATPQTEAKTHKGRDGARAYDEAVRLAPENPAAWAMRGEFRTWKWTPSQGQTFSRDGLSDYARAADLSPNDPYAQAQVPTIDGFTFEVAHHMFTSPEAARLEPAEADRRAETYLRRITAISRSARGAQGAAADTARAWVQFEFFYNPKGAQKSLRRALQQNPHQQDAIDYQMHVAGVTGDYVLLAAACRRELRRRPQVYLHVLLANADFSLAQQKPRYWKEAQAQMELAHAAAPHDDALRLGLAVVLLKSGPAADRTRAAALLGETAPSSPRRLKAQQAEYDLACGVSAALAGRQEEAREQFTSALREDPHCQPAKSALALL